MTGNLMAIAAIAGLLGLVPAFIAQSKERSFGIWWLYGALLFVVALPHALVLRQRKPKEMWEEASSGPGLGSVEMNTRAGLRRLAEDAVVDDAETQWRPVGFDENVPEAEVHVVGPSHIAANSVPAVEWIRVGQAFSPAAPINRQRLFAGRHKQMEELIDVAFERGRHAVVFGERGVGKTSMATVMMSVFSALGAKLAIKINCDATDSFDDIWRNVFDELDFTASASDSMGEEMSAQISKIVTEIPRDRPLSHNDVRKTLRMITALKECVIFVDEFERLRDPKATELLAGTLKMLSDQEVPATIIIVGVADNIQDLLNESRSIERALVQVHMPRMSRQELREIIERALGLAGMTIQEDAREVITEISKGLPHFTHLIGQSAARAAIDDREEEIAMRHVDTALAVLVDKAYGSIVDEYGRAVFSHRETLYPQVLLAAAMAETDDQAFFAAADLVKPMSRIAGKPYDIPAFSRHLHALAEKNRGPALQRKGAEHRYRFRFANPLLQPYVLMKGLTEKIVSTEDLLDAQQTEDVFGDTAGTGRS